MGAIARIFNPPAPPPPPPPPPPPTAPEPTPVLAAGEKVKEEVKKKRGQLSTLVTGPLGAELPAIGSTSLLTRRLGGTPEQLGG